MPAPRGLAGAAIGPAQGYVLSHVLRHVTWHVPGLPRGRDGLRIQGMPDDAYDPASIRVLAGLEPSKRDPADPLLRWVNEFLGLPAAEAVRPTIVSDPAVMSGDPVVSGTRVPALTIVAYLRAGHSDRDIHEDYPTLPPGSVDAVRRWAADIEEAIVMVRSAPDVPADPGDEWPPVASEPGGVPGGVPEAPGEPRE